jgi:hypothetical protein
VKILSDFFLCAVCFGEPGSLMTRGAFWAAIFLLAIVGTVLASIAGTAFAWAKRARQLEKNP